MGGDHTAFGPGYGAPNVVDFDWRRRPATLDDLENFYRLTHMAPAIQINGGVIVEPTDVAILLRHLHMVAQGFRLTDKPVLGPVTSAERAADAIAMAQLVFGADFVDRNAVYIALINSNSPRVWEETMLAVLKIYARNGQAVLCQPFTMLGASMPANSAAVVALSYAEALTAIALMQIIRPGAPAIMGCGTDIASMKTGGPMAATPESFWALCLGAQMARHYRLPCRALAGASSSKHPDMFAGYEAGMKTLPTMLAGINFINHTGGMLEGLLTMSYAKCAADYELMDMIHVTGGDDDRDGADEALETLAHDRAERTLSRHRPYPGPLPLSADAAGTTTPTSSGTRRAASAPTSGAACARSICWRPTSRRTSTPTSTPHWTTSSNGAARISAVSRGAFA